MDHEQRPAVPLDSDVLAFIPDVDAPPGPAASATTAGRPLGRLLSQAASAKLLLAAAAVLVVAAIVPFLFGKKDRPRPVADGAPVWQPGPVSPKADLRGTAKPSSVGEPTPLFGDRAVPPASPADERLGTLPPPRYPSTGAPAYAPLSDSRDIRYEARRPAPAHEPQRSPVGVNRPMAVSDPSPGTAPEFGPADGRDYTPAYRGEATPDYRPEMPADYRQDTAADYRSGATPSLADRRMTPPSGGQAPAAGQPGVARIEGIIDTPPARIAHEFARPGVY